MSCFWDAIIRCISLNEMNTVFKTNYSIITPKLLAENLKINNKKTETVIWNGKDLSSSELTNHKEHIDCYDVNTINNGYWCSSCDPFLILISELFNISITNNFNGIKINYTNTISNKVIYLNNNNSHMR